MACQKIDFYYFSGTGNTLLVVQKMKEVFERHGTPVNLHRIETTDPKDVNTEHAIGLGFPVAEQGTYPFVWEFIHALPPAQDTPIFMVDTMFFCSGGIVGPVKKIVSAKGYNPVGAREIMMPNNFFPKAAYEEKNRIKITRGLEQAEHYAEHIVAGTSHWGRIPGLSDVMGMFSRSKRTWDFLRKGYCFSIDLEKCSQCGMCTKLCPVDNIVMNEYPEYGKTCFICMHCIAFCPKEAIFASKVHFRKKPYHLYRAVRANEVLRNDTGEEREGLTRS